MFPKAIREDNNSGQNLTYMLISILGSPLYPCIPQLEAVETVELFEHAFKNRVGLLYLETLKAQGKLSSLRTQYNQMKAREKETHITLIRACRLLNNVGIPYFVTMSLRPFPYAPNDVEVVHLGTKGEYKEMIKTFRKNGYLLLITGPDAALLADPRGIGQVERDKSGGRYYVDYSISVSADHFQFTDKNKMSKHISPIELRNITIPVLDMKMELTAAIAHSVIEQRIGMEIFYFLSHVLAIFTEVDFEDWKNIARQHRLVTPIRAVLALASHIHWKVFGKIPEQLETAMQSMGKSKNEVHCFIAQGEKLRHRVSLRTFIETLIEKQFEWNAFRTTFIQLLNMLDPSFLRDVGWQLRMRRSGEDAYKHR